MEAKDIVEEMRARLKELHAEAALLSRLLEGVKPAAKAPGKREWTPERRAAQSRKLKAFHRRQNKS